MFFQSLTPVANPVFEPLIAHCTLSHEEWSLWMKTLRSSSQDDFPLGDIISALKPSGRWVVFTEEESFPGMDFLEWLSSAAIERAVLGTFLHSCDSLEAVARDLLILSRLIPCSDTVAAIAVPAQGWEQQEARCLEIQRVNFPVWKIPGGMREQHSQACLLGLCGDSPDETRVFSKRLLAPVVRKLNLVPVVLEGHSLPADWYHPGVKRVSFVIPLTVELFAGVLLAIQEQGWHPDLTLQGLFYDHAAWPENCFAISALVGVPSVNTRSQSWSLNVAELVGRNVLKQNLKALAYPGHAEIGNLKGGIAIIGAAADMLGTLVPLIAHLHSRHLSVPVVLLDIAAAAEPVALACHRYQVIYKNVVRELTHSSVAGAFIEAWSKLPEGSWTVLPLADPTVALAGELLNSAGVADANREILALEQGQAAEKRLSMTLALAAIGIISDDEARAFMKGTAELVGSVFTAPAHSRLPGLCLDLVNQASLVANKSVDFAAAIVSVAAARLALPVRRVEDSLVNENETALIQSNRPALRPAKGHAAVILVPAAAPAQLWRRLAAWNWAEGSRVILIMGGQGMPGKQELLAAWDGVHVTFHQLTEVTESVSFTPEQIFSDALDYDTLCILESRLEPLPGAGLDFSVPEEAWSCLIPDGHPGPVYINRERVTGITFNESGRISDILASDEQAVSYDPSRQGWIALN